MALDSLEKRRNVPGVGRPWMRMQHPVATPDEQWRIAVGLAYGGNTIAAVTGRVMSSLVASGGLVGEGGIAGQGGGLAG